jgi:sugar phosphate isomerase/epimerase
MTSFVKLWRCLAAAKNRLVVSNLCWTSEDRALALLRRYGITNLEIAVTACQPWNDPVDAIKKRYDGFDVYSMQALFYGIESNVFEDVEGFLKHWELVAKIAGELGVKRLVFGSPKNRLVPEGMELAEAKSLFVAAFRCVSEMLGGVCIEHNAPEYGCNFVTTVQEAAEIVTEIDRCNVMINLDTGNAAMTGCSISPIPDRTGHIQVSYPFLGPIEKDLSLDLKGYDGMISMECRGLTSEGFESSLETFVIAVGEALRKEYPPSQICQ